LLHTFSSISLDPIWGDNNIASWTAAETDGMWRSVIPRLTFIVSQETDSTREACKFFVDAIRFAICVAMFLDSVTVSKDSLAICIQELFCSGGQHVQAYTCLRFVCVYL
jgi:hypothetical protein